MTAQRPDETPLLTHAARVLDLLVVGVALFRLGRLGWRRAA